MGCMCNKNKTNKQEPINNTPKQEPINNTPKQEPINNIDNIKKSQENINSLNKKYKKENFTDLSNYLSNNWIYIVIIILILICLLYYFFLIPNIPLSYKM